jgi:DNA-binding response OmpR family regulator
MSKINLTKIVYVEDDRDMVELVTTILNKRGFKIIGVTDSTKALTVIKKEKPAMILLDLMLPVIDGWEIYQKLKKNQDTKSIPVIIITAKTETIDRILGLKIAKADGYICKPFRLQELIESIESSLPEKPK